MKDDKEVTNKTFQYILESLDVMIKNENVLLERIRKLEQGMEILAGEKLDELGLKDEDDRTIN